MSGENRLLELRERGGNEEWERKTVEMERRKGGRKEGKNGKKGAELEADQLEAAGREKRKAKIQKVEKSF